MSSHKKSKVVIRDESGRSCILDSYPPVPPLREVRKQVRMEIMILASSNRERDGVVRDISVIYEIACLRRALELLPKRETK